MENSTVTKICQSNSVVLFTFQKCSHYSIFIFTEAVQSDKTYQEEFDPPPEGSATGVGKQEKVVPVEDPDHDQEQVQHRSVFISSSSSDF